MNGVEVWRRGGAICVGRIVSARPSCLTLFEEISPAFCPPFQVRVVSTKSIEVVPYFLHHLECDIAIHLADIIASHLKSLNGIVSFIR